MIFSTRFSLASAVLLSSLAVGTSEETTAKIVPVTSAPDLSVVVDGKIIETQHHVVDPWIRPPRGVETQYGIGMPGDFDGYPRIVAGPYDSVEFLMRPVARVNQDNTQRHGVYVITDTQLVKDYLDGVTEHPCGEPVYSDPDLLCQVVEYQGLNATDCPSRETLFPLLEIKGASGVIGYTTSELGDLADKYGVETESGSKILSFDCPWIQGRDDEGSGRTSHCIGGMFQIVEVVAADDEVGSGAAGVSAGFAAAAAVAGSMMVMVV
jgi:hypothetical protein